jgi:sec-independent protein translocase protein TatA
MGISIWQLLIILAIALVLFGTKRLRHLGSDLGSSIRGFRDAMKEGEQQTEEDKRLDQMQGRVIDAEATKEAKEVKEVKEKDKI